MRRRPLTVLLVAFALLLAGVVCLPALMAAQARHTIRETLTREHGDAYAVVGLNVNGFPASLAGFSMYERLWTWARPGNGWEFRIAHHLALLVSDGRQLHQYHWSIRQRRLVLHSRRELPPPVRARRRGAA